MIIDLIFFVLLVFALFKGLSKGFVVAVFSFLAFVIGLAAALKLSTVVANYLGGHINVSQRWLPVLAFMVVFIIVILLVRLGAKAIEGALRMAMLGWLNKLAGVLLYALMYLFIFSIILFYAQKLNLIKPSTISASVTYPVVQQIAPKMLNVLGSVLPFFKNMFAQLESFFDALSSKAS